MTNKTNSLSHTKWMCKYHIVFIPKYRRKIIYKQYRRDLQEIIKTLCKYKGVEIIEGHMMPDHVQPAIEYTTKDECVKFHGVFERKKRIDDVRQACKFKVSVWEQTFLGRRILCEYCRAK